MAKKTREDSLVTRDLILNSAEKLFLEHGVSSTSLQKIAQTAGVTRGAIYWHFADKLAVLQGILDRAALPTDDLISQIENDSTHSPIERILKLISDLLDLIAGDQQIRNAIDILTHRVELVGEFVVMNERYMHHLNRVLKLFSKLIIAECNIRNIEITEARAMATARALNAIMDGLSHTWLLTPNEFDLKEVTISTVKAFLYGLYKYPKLIASSK